MSTGLIALLDDVVGIAKVAAASLDDVAAQAAKAGAKSAGVVIDDAAVTPRYVVGFAAERELPIIARIARGSLRNKILFLLPAALALGLLAPWAITPLLMLGGGYLCYEGAEKVLEAVAPHAAHAHEAEIATPAADAAALENRKVASAIKTDFILSAEIMALTLSTVAESGFATQAAVLAIVGIGITLGVYGVVALIVKADDAGLAMVRHGRLGATRALGRGLVRIMPGFLKLLATVGTAAMLWVGGGIILHGLESYGAGLPAHAIHDAAHWIGAAMPGRLAGPVEWLVGAAGAGLAGLAVGALLIPVSERVIAPAAAALRRARGGA